MARQEFFLNFSPFLGSSTDINWFLLVFVWCVRNDAPNVFKIFFLFSVHWQTWTFFFWFVRDVYYTNYSLQFWWQWWLFTSLLRGLVKSIFPPPFRRIIVYYLDGYWIWWSIKINRFIHEHGTFIVKERKYFYFPVLIQNWISFPQIFLSSQTWRMYKKRTWWRRLQPHPGGMLLYPRGTGGGNR